MEKPIIIYKVIEEWHTVSSVKYRVQKKKTYSNWFIRFLFGTNFNWVNSFGCMGDSDEFNTTSKEALDLFLTFCFDRDKKEYGIEPILI